MSAAPRILVVEDNPLYAEVVADFVGDCGLETVGPVCALEDGMICARDAALDGAVLDIDLNGRHCFPICAALAERHIPFVFLTGYENPAIIPAEFRSTPVVPKPFEPARLKDALEKMVSGAGRDWAASTPEASARVASLP